MANPLNDLSNAMADAVEAVTPAIVRVGGRRRLSATGIIWSADGVIVTAHHVLERDENIGVVLYDGTRLEGNVVGRDPHNDLAVIKVEASELKEATWGDNDALRVGNLVLALGAPGEQVQATLGVVSALVAGGQRQKGRKGRRRMQALAEGYIQTDVLMYPGFSGGPLVSGDGAVHGLNTSGFGSGVSVAVPVATIRSTVETLMTHGKMKQGYLGIGVQPVRLPDAVAEQEMGLLVVSVESDSPAQKSGLIVGDILVSLDDEPTEQMDELLLLLSGERVGKTVQAQIVRGGELKSIDVMIGERS